MKNILVTGGTTFVSKYTTEYFLKKNNVYVLNRNTKKQLDGVTLIEADRHDLGERLKNLHFDLVIDVTAYNDNDINDLLDSLGQFDDFVMVSSSAVYPETEKQPFTETSTVSENKYWGAYGTNKIKAEKALMSRVPNAYILRPPYLYGKYNNVYREAFVFDRALAGEPFYIPKNGEMKLQFFNVDDLCRFIEIIIEKHPKEHIFNVGNREVLSINEWVELCYKVVGASLRKINVFEDVDIRKYFPFYDYEYYLDVSAQYELMNEAVPLETGLKKSLEWYVENKEQVNKKPLSEFITCYFC